MAKGKKSKQQYHVTSVDLERSLVDKIADTGKEQVKRRRKAGLSSFYINEGKIIEVLPDNSKHVRKAVKSKWVSIEKKKRSINLK